MGAKIKQANPDAINKARKRYQSGSVLAIGFPRSEVSGLAYPDGEPVLNVAVYNHFGTQTIPRRDFMTGAGKRAVEKTKGIRGRAVKAVNSGHLSIEQVLEQMGHVAAAQVKLEIRDLKSPPNAPSTIKRKGSSNPLQDTDTMMNSVTHVVRSK